MDNRCIHPFNACLSEPLRRSAFLARMLIYATAWLLTIANTAANADIDASTQLGNHSTHHNTHYRYPIDFTLTFSNSDIKLRADHKIHHVALERISISVFSLQDKHIQWGFSSGSSYLNLSNDSALTGISLNGYHAGFALRAHFGNNPQLSLHTHYRYQKTTHETANQTAALSWHEWMIAATGKIILGQQLELTLGGAYSDIDARGYVRGDMNDSLHLQLNSNPQSLLELAWLADPNGRISVAWQSGAYENIAFNFSRTFK